MAALDLFTRARECRPRRRDRRAVRLAGEPLVARARRPKAGRAAPFEPSLGRSTLEGRWPTPSSRRSSDAVRGADGAPRSRCSSSPPSRRLGPSRSAPLRHAHHSGRGRARRSAAAVQQVKTQRAPVTLLTAAHPLHGRPVVSARSAILVDADSGRVVWEKSAHRRRPIASTTKIMTATLVLEHLSLDTVVKVPPAATRTPLVREGLRRNELVPAWKLFDGLLIFSGNDDAYALAVAAAGSKPRFVKLMNEKARALGLTTRTSRRSAAWSTRATTRRPGTSPRSPATPCGTRVPQDRRDEDCPRQVVGPDLRQGLREQEPAAAHVPRRRRSQDRAGRRSRAIASSPRRGAEPGPDRRPPPRSRSRPRRAPAA